MRNLLAFVAFAVLVVAGVGWYRGWYSVKTAPTANGGREIDVTVNTPKIKKDIDNGKQKVREFLTEKHHPKQAEPPQVPNGVPAVFRAPNSGELVLPGVDPQTIDINDYSLPELPSPPK